MGILLLLLIFACRPRTVVHPFLRLPFASGLLAPPPRISPCLAPAGDEHETREIARAAWIDEPRSSEHAMSRGSAGRTERSILAFFSVDAPCWPS